MKSLLRGEKILATFPASSKFGSCTLYMTNFGLALESTRSGLILILLHNEVLSLLPVDRNSVRLMWAEHNTVFELVFKCNKAEAACLKYRQIKQDHDLQPCTPTNIASLIETR